LREAYIIIHQFALGAGTHHFVLQEATSLQPLGVATFNDFTGPVLAEPELMANGEHKIWFNQDGLDFLAANLGAGVIGICVREYEHDYINILPPEAPPGDPGGFAQFNTSRGSGTLIRLFGD